jgi:hypothetical protein
MDDTKNSIVKKDPTGLMRRDIMYLRQVFKAEPIKPKDTLATIQYKAGQQSVIDWIDMQVRSKGGIDLQ